MFHTTGLSNIITMKDVRIKSDSIVTFIGPTSLTPPLITTDTFTYTFNGGFSPNYCLIDKVTFYNTGTDNNIYKLRSDMFSNDIQRYGILFTEKNYDSFQGIPHQIDIQNGTTFNFYVDVMAGTTTIANSTTAYLGIEMTFIQVK